MWVYCKSNLQGWAKYQKIKTPEQSEIKMITEEENLQNQAMDYLPTHLLFAKFNDGYSIVQTTS